MKQFFVIAIVFLCSCAARIPDFSQGRAYSVVETHTEPQSPDRVIRQYIIQSDAVSFEERCQTAMKAAYELSRKDKNDLTSVIMVPVPELKRSPVYYAMVLYASDGKGATGLNGSDPVTEIKWVWKVRGSDRILTDQELAVLKLYFTHMKDFPSTDPSSNRGYDAGKLTQFVANKLNLKPEEVVIPELAMKEYPVR